MSKMIWFLNTRTGGLLLDGEYRPEIAEYLDTPTMSKYLTFTDVCFKDRRMLLKALAKLGYNDVDQGENLHLIGYHGDTRADTADVVIRRKHLTSASNDIGFRKTSKGYVPIVSEYDRGAVRNGHFVADVRTQYNELTAREVARQLGGVVHKSPEKNGVIKMTVRY